MVRRLDPTLDVVFRLLLTQEPRLLHDMLQAVLARPLGAVELVEPEFLGPRVDDKPICFDVRAVVDGGVRIDLEMQRQIKPALASRLVYYAARDYADQLNRGDQYHLLTPTIGVIWLVQPLLPKVALLHSRFELRELHTGLRLSDQLAIHLLQLSYPSLADQNSYTRQVERWARFFRARHDADYDRLVREDSIMRIAVETLDQLSQDPETRRRAREREDELKLHQIDLAVSHAEGKKEGHAEGKREGRAEGKRELLRELLALRFGPLSEGSQRQVQAATSAQLQMWTERVLTAGSLSDVLGP